LKLIVIYLLVRIQVIVLFHCVIRNYILDTSEIRSETTGKSWNVVLDKDGDLLDRSCEK